MEGKIIETLGTEVHHKRKINHSSFRLLEIEDRTTTRFNLISDIILLGAGVKTTHIPRKDVPVSMLVYHWEPRWLKPNHLMALGQ